MGNHSFKLHIFIIHIGLKSLIAIKKDHELLSDLFLINYFLTGFATGFATGFSTGFSTGFDMAMV
jgi:hypothetical protein